MIPDINLFNLNLYIMLVITITIENPEASITDSKGITHNSLTTITKVLEYTSDLSELLSNISDLSTNHLECNEMICGEME